jgi:hypothetical protein
MRRVRRGSNAGRCRVALLRAAALVVALVCGARPGSSAFADEAPAVPEKPGLAIRYIAPPSAPKKACSLHLPICMHGSRESEILRALSASERMFGALRQVTGWASVRPGSPHLDLYQVEGSDFDAPSAEAHLLERCAFAGFDTARAFVVLHGVPKSASGLDAQVALGLALASSYVAAPAADRFSRLGIAAALAELASGRATKEADSAQADSAAYPEASILFGVGERPQRAFASTAFFRWLDLHYGQTSGQMLPLLWAYGPTKTPTDAPHWFHEPTTLDVLRESMKDARFLGSKLDDILMRFATDRAFFDRSESHLTLPEPAWELAWPVAPRRILAPRPIAPLGASYILIDRRSARKGARLRLEAEWELEARIRWSVVKLDAQFQELSRMTLGAAERATEVQGSITELDQSAYVLIVAVNLGNPKFVLNPDDELREPHTWLLSLAEE